MVLAGGPEVQRLCPQSPLRTLRCWANGNNGAADRALEQRLYFAHNWRSDVSVTMTDTGRILEWIKYSTYGVAQRVPIADFNGDSFVDFFDDADYDDCYTGAGCPSGQTADINLDGFVDSFDYDEWDLNFAEQGSSARGVLAQSTGSAAVNRIGYAGYFFEPSTQQYLVRNRELDPNTGLWDERDPMGYHDGSDLYSYATTAPVSKRDPSGLVSSGCTLEICCGQMPLSLYQAAHCWIVCTDSQGHQEAFRAGPTGLFWDLWPEVQGNTPPSCDGWTIFDGAWGPIDTHIGPWDASNPDWGYTPRRCRTIQSGSEACDLCRCVRGVFTSIERCCMGYELLGPNCNSAIFSALARCGMDHSDIKFPRTPGILDTPGDTYDVCARRPECCATPIQWDVVPGGPIYAVAVPVAIDRGGIGCASRMCGQRPPR